MKPESRTLTREFAACTIVAKNYLPMARVLALSWKQFHPDCPFFVLFLDSPGGFFDPALEIFESVYPSDLDIPNLQGFLFKYSILEASTAVKPYLLTHLFREHGIQKLLYIDPDILLLNSLSHLREYLDSSNILLTPHLLEPIPNDGRRQTEHDILKSGTFNLGFLGLRNSPESERLLRWWSDKLYHHCIVSVEQNLFVDQRWMDLAPTLFSGVRIIREPGYNIAYWNLHERLVAVDGDSITVNGSEPVYFLHFSGFDPDKPWLVSKHQNRFRMADIGELRQLYLRYRTLLLANGWEDASRWTYGLDYFDSGVKIPSSARRYYWSLGPNVAHLGDPFSWLDVDLVQEAIDEQQGDAPPIRGGVNLVGYYGAETGVGEGARSNLRIIQAAGIPFSVTNEIDFCASNVEVLPESVGETNPYLANLITINANGLVAFAERYGTYLKGHFNIGYWAWELSEFPREWTKSFGYLDEVWTPSRFTRDSVAAHSPIPVRVVPHAIDPNTSFEPADRSKFHLRPDVFVFLFCFDFESFLERKNLVGLIKAFKQAFGTRDDVLLLIKSVHGSAHPENLELLQRIAGGSNVRIVDTVLSRSDKDELMMAADCYVSLHRSEGFGLTMAEAMLCGKPVIATAYSGNVDFMSDEDSFLVPYRKITIERSVGPYKAGYHWADPDLDYAVDAMRLVEGNREYAARVGSIARTKVSKLLHPATIAVSVRSRLEELGLLEEALPASR